MTNISKTNRTKRCSVADFNHLCNTILTKLMVKMKKYQCTICGFVYDPVEGDPDSGIAPGTAFEDIPDDWMCPVCGVTKDDFEPIDE